MQYTAAAINARGIYIFKSFWIGITYVYLNTTEIIPSINALEFRLFYCEVFQLHYCAVELKDNWLVKKYEIKVSDTLKVSDT